MEDGTVLADRYRIDRLIGEGAFASVYRAADLRADRDVAVKMLHVAPGSRHGREVRRRFVREAELVGKINHPDVVEVYEFGVTAEGRLFIALELLVGSPLDEYLELHGPFDVPRAVGLVARCLDAVHAAHMVGSVHRDLKPGNLYIQDAGGAEERLRILDFGLAYIRHQVGNRLSQTGQIHGTLEYLAPEYVQEQVVTPALDVYQMGLILAELVSGRPAVVAKTPFQAIIAHVQGKLDVPDELRADPYGPIMATALAVDHNARFRHAGEFAEALRAALRGDIPELHASIAFEETVHVPTKDAADVGEEADREPRQTRPLGESSGTIEPVHAADSSEVVVQLRDEPEEIGSSTPARPLPPPTRKLRSLREIFGSDDDEQA